MSTIINWSMGRKPKPLPKKHRNRNNWVGRRTTCKYCGEPVRGWRLIEDTLKLFDLDDKVHACDKEKSRIRRNISFFEKTGFDCNISRTRLSREEVAKLSIPCDSVLTVQEVIVMRDPSRMGVIVNLKVVVDSDNLMSRDDERALQNPNLPIQGRLLSGQFVYDGEVIDGSYPIDRVIYREFVAIPETDIFDMNSTDTAATRSVRRIQRYTVLLSQHVDLVGVPSEFSHRQVEDLLRPERMSGVLDLISRVR